MSLSDYRRKRDFTATPEPKGRKARKQGRSFVIHKHDARRLHYDLRLELDGVLLSWAVTRGPSLVAAEKRLAVHVEDHPLSYGDFEGTIPKGQYGAGTVLLWDQGTWDPIGDARKAYAKGHLEFELAGQKLKGRWHLIRMQDKPKGDGENWLLIKAQDTQARPKSAPDILEDLPLSVKTGRTLQDIAAGKAAAAPPTDVVVPPVKGAKRQKLPDFVPPMLAHLAASSPTGQDWLHEIKFDGYRLQARLHQGKLKLITRRGLDWTLRFGRAVSDALGRLPVQSALIDGEVVVEARNGASDFSALQADLSAGRCDRFLFYGFDLLHLDGRDLRPLPLVQRKSLLETLLAQADGPLRYSSHFSDSGAMVLRHACRLGLEGILSKKSNSPYREGRNKDWIKSKCSARQEFVIGGYMPSTAQENAIGSLVLGVYDGDQLIHVGRVGTGFSADVAHDIASKLEPLHRKTSPFAQPLSHQQSRQIRYVQPELVAEVEFRAWTAEGNLRHASFRGLREDKPAREIIRETASPNAAMPPLREVQVKLTHPERIYWPEEGITKEGLADYYAQIWPQIAPFVVGRPLALLRCPEGITGQRFFQKHMWKGAGRHILPVNDPKNPAEPLISIDTLEGLIALVQSAALEIHPWGCALQDWERPDMITMDLDPAEGVPWSQVIDAARELQDRLTQAQLAAFVKTSGGKGLHVVAPLQPHAKWSEVKAFTKAMAQSMASDSPDLYVATISKAKRKGKILIDYLRNQRGATAVAAYSPRARAGAPVSTPLDWQELGPEIGPAHFTITNIGARFSAKGQFSWDEFRAAARPLKAKKT